MANNPDIMEVLWAMGVPLSDMKDLTQVEPFRISTVGERLLIRKATEDSFGLSEGGYVENPWGFPPMPLPKHRSTTSEGLIIAPESISFEGLGHPIFWIDPRLTRRTEEERQHPERWAVRMFYLLMALEMFTEDLKWYNVPNSQGVDYSKEDWLAYRQGTSSVLDNVRPLDENDLVVPLASITEQTKTALARCADAQAEVWARYRTELDAAYSTAVVSTQGRGEWDALDARMKETTQQIVAQVEGGVVPTSLVPEVYAQVDELERILAHTERCATFLSMPILATKSISNRAATAATALKVAQSDVSVDVNTLRTEAHRLFELSSTAQPADFVRLHSTATAIYMNSWRALMLAARNLVRAAEGADPLQSWETLELVESVDSTQWPPLGGLLERIGL